VAGDERHRALWKPMLERGLKTAVC
jgi:hypothetical protein